MIRSVIGRETIFSMIETRLGLNPTSNVEYLFTKPCWKNIFKSLGGTNSSVNPYGHSVVRYQLPGEIHRIMNICGSNNDNLVNFIPPEDYLFTDQTGNGNEQGGIFNRPFLGLRLENRNQEEILDINRYFQNLDLLNQQERAEFQIFLFQFTNLFRPFFHSARRGNCSYWTGNGFAEAGIISKTSSYPLYLFFKIFLTQLAKDPNNINIVSYRSLNYLNEPEGALIYPFYWLKHSYQDIWRLDTLLANLVLTIKEVDGKFIIEYEERPHIKENWIKFAEKLRGVIKV